MHRPHRAGESLWSLHPAAVWPDRAAPQKHPMPAPGRRRWRRPVAVAVAAAGVLAMLAADGAFGVTLTETYLSVENRSIYPDGTVLTNEDELSVPEGGAIDASTRVAKLMSTTAAAQYPREPNNVPNNFVSSELDGYGNYGLGASAIAYSPSTRIAEATYARSYRNDGTTPEAFEVGFTIPRMEVSLGGYPALENLTARASAFAFYEVRNADDRVVNEGDLFDYWLQADKAPMGPGGTFDVAWLWSEDLGDILLATAGLTQEDESYGSLTTTSLSVSPFSANFLFDALNPGETITFMLSGEARLAVGPGGVEGGGQALVGDPFEVSSPQGPVFDFTIDGDAVVPPVATVPVPAAAWLLVTALLPVFALRRRSGARQRD